jgi:hypothetical protein
MAVTATLPWAVDQPTGSPTGPGFAATGYIGDYWAITNAGDTTGTLCGGRAVTGAKGQCWKVTYKVATDDAGAIRTAGFAGVNWQANVQPMGGGSYYNNFGVAPGIVPPPGATQVTLYAKGAAGGEQVTFSVGSGATNPCTDSVVATSAIATLTTNWQLVTIPFNGATYAGGQVQGFGWEMATAGEDAGATTTFYMDDIVWTAGGTSDAGASDAAGQ